MTITLGYWLIPLLTTIGLWVWVNHVCSNSTSRGGMFDFTGFFESIAAIIGSLLSWLIYFICLAIFRH